MRQSLKGLSAALGLLGVVVIALAVGACGSGGGDSTFVNGSGDGGDGSGDDGGLLDDGGGDGNIFGTATVTSLFFVPANATLTLDGMTPKNASFVLNAKMSDGTTSVVNGSAQYQFDRPDLATLATTSGVVLTAGGPFAGTGVLHGIYKGLEAKANLTIAMNIVQVGTGVPANVVTALGRPNLPADPSLTSLLYPYDQTAFPLGMTTPLVMWSAPNASDFYRVHLEQTNYSFDGYYAVPQPAQVRVDQATWDHLTASNGGDPLKLTLSRWNTATQTAYTSATESWTIVGASLRGAIYYWTVSNLGHMSRIRPGTGAIPEVLNGGKCMGCHAVSADGSTLVAAIEGMPTSDSSDTRPWASFDLPAPPAAPVQRTQSTIFAANLAVNPDGKYVVEGTLPLTLSDSRTGTKIPNTGIETVALSPGMNTLAHPVFSPDGKRLAAVQSNDSWHSWTNGVLTVTSFDEPTTKFTSPTNLASGTMFASGLQAIAYPTFAPDSTWLAFHVADYAGGCHASCDANVQDIGAIWMQNVSNAAPIRLAKLTDFGVSTADKNESFEPTFNPIERGGYFWVVFTSTRDWGNKITGQPINGKKRLWVAAIDKTIGTVDPSHPAFFLEGQEESTMNMRGFWALAACTPTVGGGTCAVGAECCSGFCDMGKCVDTNTVACKGSGETCMMTADCCNPTTVSCTNGVCKITTPR